MCYMLFFLLIISLIIYIFMIKIVFNLNAFMRMYELHASYIITKKLIVEIELIFKFFTVSMLIF